MIYYVAREGKIVSYFTKRDMNDYDFSPVGEAEEVRESEVMYLYDVLFDRAAEAIGEAIKQSEKEMTTQEKEALFEMFVEKVLYEEGYHVLSSEQQKIFPFFDWSLLKDDPGSFRRLADLKLCCDIPTN